MTEINTILSPASKDFIAKRAQQKEAAGVKTKEIHDIIEIKKQLSENLPSFKQSLKIGLLAAGALTIGSFAIACIKNPDKATNTISAILNLKAKTKNKRIKKTIAKRNKPK